MSLILRKIQKSKWYKNEAVAWLPGEELQADALADIRTQGNTLSVYIIEDTQTDLERVATALAGTRNVITDFEYALFDQTLLSKLEIAVENSDGDTADDSVNKWHRELVELTASKLLALAQIIRNNEKGRVLSKHILGLMVTALSSKQIDRNRLKLNPEVLEKLDRMVER